MNANESQQIADIGSWVKVRISDLPQEENDVFYLVEPREADLIDNKLPPHNAMAQALAGRRPGDEVWMDAPAGQIKYTVLEVGQI